LIHTFKIHDLLSYQAFLAYNPKDFLGVITNWRRCRGEEIEAQLPLGDDIDLIFDDRQRLDTLFGCNHLSGDSMKDEFSGDSIVQKIVGDSTGMT
jgi:hypothetical protein